MSTYNVPRPLLEHFLVQHGSTRTRSLYGQHGGDTF